MVDEQKALREEIAELRGQVIAWQKQCDTLTHQVLCCGVAASHPDATLTTQGAYAGKWNSAQAEEVRKLRADRDQMREERTAWRVTAENAEEELAAIKASLGEPVAWLVCSVNKDKTLSPEFAAAWRDAAHDHIKDAVEYEIEGAAEWVVRPVYALTNKDQS